MPPDEVRRLRSDETLAAGLAAWNPKLQAGRITTRFFNPGGYGASLFSLAAEHCRAGLGVRPTLGTALFFEARDAADGLETIAAAHGSCGLPAEAPTKRVLVKIACDGKVRNGPS